MSDILFFKLQAYVMLIMINQYSIFVECKAKEMNDNHPSFPPPVRNSPSPSKCLALPAVPLNTIWKT